MHPNLTDQKTVDPDLPAFIERRLAHRANVRTLRSFLESRGVPVKEVDAAFQKALAGLSIRAALRIAAGILVMAVAIWVILASLDSTRGELVVVWYGGLLGGLGLVITGLIQLSKWHPDHTAGHPRGE